MNQPVSSEDGLMSAISVNHLCEPLVKKLVADSAVLRLGTHVQSCGTTVVDAGVNTIGGIEAGLRIAELCMAGLGRVSLVSSASVPNWPWAVQVSTSQPVLACMASQYAGWSLSINEGDSKYFAMASGPGRALANKEELFRDIDYRDRHDTAVLVLESDTLPPDALSLKIAADCQIEPADLTLIVTPTGSLAGGTQVAARIVEVALHKAHELEFPLERIIDAVGVTPLPPPISNSFKAMGRTNDTILFGGQVHLFVTGDDADAKNLAEQLPCTNSPDYGEPFEEVFSKYDHDFFKIDGHLFSPGKGIITAVESGKSFRAGYLSTDLIDRSFGFVNS